MTEKILTLTKVTSKGATTIPVQVRRRLKLEKYDWVAWVDTGKDIVVRKGRWVCP